MADNLTESIIDDESLEKVRQARRRNRRQEPMSIADVFFGNSATKEAIRNKKRQVYFRYATIWFALILAFSTFLIWKFL